MNQNQSNQNQDQNLNQDHNQIKIKICGLNRIQDIEIVNKYNPDYIGFVFAESKRKIDFEQALKLKKNLNKEILAVGVFVNHNIEDIIYLIDNNIIDIVQIHGNEDKEFIDKLKSFNNNIKVIKAIEIKNNSNNSNNSNILTNNNNNNNNNFDKIIDGNDVINIDHNKDDFINKINYWENSAVDYLLLDSGKGTGKTFDWRLIEDIKKPFFLAGGINSENIHEAYKINSFAIDLSSGVEENGVKSSKKIAKIMNDLNDLNDFKDFKRFE